MLHTVNLWKTDVSTRGFNPICRFHEKKKKTRKSCKSMMTIWTNCVSSCFEISYIFNPWWILGHFSRVYVKTKSLLTGKRTGLNVDWKSSLAFEVSIIQPVFWRNFWGGRKCQIAFTKTQVAVKNFKWTSMKIRLSFLCEFSVKIWSGRGRVVKASD